MKIQVFSDLHLEFFNYIPSKALPKPNADYLFLAGDIGKLDTKTFQLFFDYVSKEYKRVFYVLGNHEFYHSTKTINELLEEYRSFFRKYSNVTLLEKEVVELEGWNIMGCTLWSEAGNSSYKYTNCFRHIRVQPKKEISVEEWNKLNNEAIWWIKSHYQSNKPTILMSHFPAIHTLTSHPQYRNQSQEVIRLFGNDLKLIPKEGVSLVCIAGHTHYSYDIDKDGVRYLSNQYGYHDESPGLTKFSTKGIFQLD